MVGKWTNEPCSGVDEVVNTFWVLTTLRPLAREGKIIASTSFTTSTSIANPSLLVYEIEIQGDSDLDSVPTSKLEARKMTGNSPDTQKERLLRYAILFCLLQRDAIEFL